MIILTEIRNIFAIYEFPQSKGVKKYKFKIKKENERCLEYLVEDLDHEYENIKFKIPLAFQVSLIRYTTIPNVHLLERRGVVNDLALPK